MRVFLPKLGGDGRNGGHFLEPQSDGVLRVYVYTCAICNYRIKTTTINYSLLGVIGIVEWWLQNSCQENYKKKIMKSIQCS